MQKINLKPFVKHLYKNKLYTLITVLGFAISLAFVILLSVYVKNELSVNNKQINKNRIYRLVNEKISNTAPPVGAWLQKEIPEIASFTRIKSMNGIISGKGLNKLNIEYLLADSTFFQIFNFKLLQGNKNSALKTRNSIVLTRSFANKLFGTEPAIGKEVIINMKVPFIVTGIVDDISKTSHFAKCDALINFRALKDIWGWDDMETDFDNCSFDLYLLEKPNANLPAKAPQILEMFKKQFWIYRDNRVKQVIFEPLSEVYFSNLNGTGTRNNSKTLISILVAIVILILFLAIINYLNLTIAQSGLRVKEIALKKLLGDSRRNLIIQHITETVILCNIAFIIAVVLSFLLEPQVNTLLQTKLNLADEFKGFNLLIIIIFIIITGFISGIIPSLLITKLKAVDVIKGGFTFKSKTVYSKILIAFQYTVVIILVISTFVIIKQTRFLLNHNPGFNTEKILKAPCMIGNDKYDALKNELLKIPGVKNVSFVKGDPIDGGNNQSFNYKAKPVSFQVFVVDSAFFKMMKLKITPTGTAYSKRGIWLNKTAVKGLGLDSLPKEFLFYDKKLPVLGVTNDFNFNDLHQKIGMMMIQSLQKDDYAWNILVQTEGKNQVETVAMINKTYSDFTQGIPVEFNFINEIIQKWYEKEQRTSKILGYFALLSIIISVMGIFAMSVFYNRQKIKEIGIRKVNGATVFEIIKLLNKDFIKLVTVAFVIAVPIAWFVMNKWLENFAYKIDLSWWIFVLAGALAMLIALITVSWNTFVAARRNPVEALKYE